MKSVWSEEEDVVIEEEEDEGTDEEEVVIEDVTEEEEEFPSLEFVSAPSAKSVHDVIVEVAPLADADKARARDSARVEGNVLYGKKKFKEAVEAYGVAIEADPYAAGVYSNRAAAYLGLGQWVKAQEDAEEAVRLDPGLAKGWYRLAVARGKLGAFEQALEACAFGKRVAEEEEEEAGSSHAVSLLSNEKGPPTREVAAPLDKKEEKDVEMKKEEKKKRVSLQRRAFCRLRRDLNIEWKKAVRRKKIQSDLRELSEEMTPEERRWKAWWAGQGHPTLVNNSNLDKYVPDAAVDVSYDPEVSKVLKGPDNLPRLDEDQDDDVEDDNDLLLEEVLQETEIFGTKVVTVFEDAGCGPRSLLTCARLDPLRPQLRRLLLPTNALDRLTETAELQSLDALRKSWDFDSLLKFPSKEIRDLAGIGLDMPRFSWRQKVNHIEVRVLLPPFVDAQDLTVVVEPRRLAVVVRNLKIWPYRPNSWVAISDLGPQSPPPPSQEAPSIPPSPAHEQVPGPAPLALEEFHKARGEHGSKAGGRCWETSDGEDDKVPVEELDEDDDVSLGSDEPIVEELPVECVEEKEKHAPEPAVAPKKLTPRDVLVRWEERGLTLKTLELETVPCLVTALQDRIKLHLGLEPKLQALTASDRRPIRTDIDLAFLFEQPPGRRVVVRLEERAVVPLEAPIDASSPPDSIVLLDFLTSKKIYVDDSIWHISKPDALKGHALQGPVLVLQLKKFHDLKKGTARHAGQLWWRHLFIGSGEDCALETPPAEFYSLES